MSFLKTLLSPPISANVIPVRSRKFPRLNDAFSRNSRSILNYRQVIWSISDVSFHWFSKSHFCPVLKSYCHLSRVFRMAFNSKIRFSILFIPKLISCLHASCKTARRFHEIRQAKLRTRTAIMIQKLKTRFGAKRQAIPPLKGVRGMF